MLQAIGTQRDYKLRVRCLSCVTESYPRITIIEPRSDVQSVDRALRRKLADEPFECSKCGGDRSSVVAYFEAVQAA